MVLIALLLSALWFAGLAMHAQTWLTWLNGVAAILAFIIAGMFGPGQPDNDRRWLSAVLALSLFGLWLAALISGAAPWLTWFTFAAGCVVAIIAVGGNRPMVRNAP
jgi:hypothetical protein